MLGFQFKTRRLLFCGPAKNASQPLTKAPSQASAWGLAGALLLGSTQAMASPEADVEALAKSTGCYSCHAAAEKVLGPSFQAIAAKYAGDSGAVAVLSQAIKNGSKGKWGRIPMPGHPSLSNEDLTRLSQWVVGFKP